MRSRTIAAAVLLGAMAVLAPRASVAQEVKTIKPGMTEAEVRGVWGDPLTGRSMGDYSYLYFRNDCLQTCGTYDVVILEKGQVVDAVVRASDHAYDGMSSSPPDRKPGYTAP